MKLSKKILQATVLLGSVRCLDVKNDEEEESDQLSGEMIPIIDNSVILMDYVATDTLATKLQELNERLTFRWNTIYKKDTLCLPINHECTTTSFSL